MKACINKRWPWAPLPAPSIQPNESEAGVDLVLIGTSLLFL